MLPIDFHNPTFLIAAAVIGLLIITGILLAVKKSRSSARLRKRFGPEYDNVLRENGHARVAEARLLERVNRVERLKIRELTTAERDRFLTRWEMIQLRFIDHPRGAVIEADELLNEVLLARGYPVGSFDQRVADISVNHAHLVEPYRTANSATARVGRNEATTEELRAAMVHYRALLEDLMQLVATPITHKAVA
jgi:hypothetical protein